MGVHAILVNKTKLESIDLGKRIGDTFQMPDEILIKYLVSCYNDELLLTTDTRFDDIETYPEVDSWHLHFGRD